MNSQSLSLSEIHKLEIAEAYPAAIDQLELRIIEGHSDPETIIRLGFNLWYAVAETDRLTEGLPTSLYRRRFVDLFHQHEGAFDCYSDFCWAFGLGFSLFPYEFVDTPESIELTESIGQSLLTKARNIDPFYADFSEPSDLAERFTGRGIFQSYYALAVQH